MSMEQAILELASGMKELATAVRAATDSRTVGMSPLFAAPYVEQDEDLNTIAKDIRNSDEYKKLPSEDKQPVTESQELAAAEKAAEVEPDAELDAAVAKVEKDAIPLDYAKDVKPVLLQLVKTPGKGRPALAELLAKYNVPNGDKLTVEQLPGILADAQALMAE